MIEIGPIVVATTREISQEIKMAAIPQANSVVDVPVAIGKSR
jgi:hypothetical protein